ncbi:outer membrane lipid asymmetry maintenance protein MlaD [Parasutterella excrementihominis]|uniref:outer membrane lipid asymmetry maintenance protein MlaD n=1 Tax=Parasutterella excrementihominis TaxID=487175 RepID=UPI003078EE2A
MQNQNTKINFLVGLFVLGGIVALLFLALQAANLSSFSTSKGYEVTAYFDNIGGLKARAPVRSAGVLVGRVKSISYDNDTFQAKVVISMENQFKFPSDTSAKILTAGLIGEQYIGLQPGADDKDLTNGGRIEFTQSAVVLENLISQFMFNKAEENAGSKKE